MMAPHAGAVAGESAVQSATRDRQGISWHMCARPTAERAPSRFVIHPEPVTSAAAPTLHQHIHSRPPARNVRQTIGPSQATAPCVRAFRACMRWTPPLHLRLPPAPSAAGLSPTAILDSGDPMSASCHPSTLCQARLRPPSTPVRPRTLLAAAAAARPRQPRSRARRRAPSTLPIPTRQLYLTPITCPLRILASDIPRHDR